MKCQSQSLVPYRLGYTPSLTLARLGGFEPPAHGLEVRCSIQLSYRRKQLERVKGIEPSQPAWKAGALPLSYTRMIKKLWSGRRDSNPRPSPWQGDALPLSHFRIFLIFLVEGTGFEPVKAEPTDLQSVPFGQLGNPSLSFVELARGIEPPTY